MDRGGGVLGAVLCVGGCFGAGGNQWMWDARLFNYGVSVRQQGRGLSCVCAVCGHTAGRQHLSSRPHAV